MDMRARSGQAFGRAASAPLAGVAAWLARRPPGHRLLIAAAAGLASVLAMPPFGAFPVLFAAFPVLLWLLDGCRTWKGALACGWAFGFGFLTGGLYWIGNALLVDGWRWWWMLPIAVAGLPAALAFYAGAVTLLCRAAGLTGVPRIVLFAGLWTLGEYARGMLFTGFPWNLIGYAWDRVPAMLQSAAWVGVYGLSFVTVACAAMPALLGGRPADGAPGERSHREVTGRQVTAMVGAVLGLGLLWAAGGLRLVQGAPAAPAGPPAPMLRLVQPDIAQSTKWDTALRATHLRTLIRMSRSDGLQPGMHVVWPETAVPFLFGGDPALADAIAAAAPPGGSVITGVPREAVGADGASTLHNAMVAVAPDATVLATYDKAHLVPFGEYVPLRGLLGFAKITAGTRDFTPGPGPRAVAIPGLPPVSPLICYEVIFPGAVTPPAAGGSGRPAWMLNLTNDGWYGYSTGPFQHFAIARVRSIEEGLPLVRVANTGISGVFDAQGRVVARLGLEERGTLDVALPPPLASPTLFARVGNRGVIGAVVVITLVIPAVFRARRGIATKGNSA